MIAGSTNRPVRSHVNVHCRYNLSTRWAVLVILCLETCVFGQPAVSFRENRPVAVKGVVFKLHYDLTYMGDANLKGKTKLHHRITWNGHLLQIQTTNVSDANGILISSHTATGLVVPARGWQTINLEVSFQETFVSTQTASHEQWLVPGAVTLLPPIVVVLIALLTQEVIYSLFLGIVSAVFIVQNYNIFAAFLTALDTYLVNAIATPGHAYIISFTCLISGLLGAMEKAGGTLGFTNLFARFAESRKTVQLTVSVLGLVIFFNGTANVLILGNTMRVFSDAAMISREKFAFLVDSTAGNLASIVPISSWTGFQVGLIQQALETSKESGEDLTVLPSAYQILLETIPSRFFPIFLLWFQFVSILTLREWGPMLTAERRAIDEGKLVNDQAKIKGKAEQASITPKTSTPLCWWNGLVPISVLISLLLLTIVITGEQITTERGENVTAESIFSNGDTYSGLIYSSTVSILVAWVMYRFQYVFEGKIVLPFRSWIRLKSNPGHPLLSMEQSLNATIVGVKVTLETVLIYTLAWAASAAINDSGADMFLSSTLSSNLDPHILPTLAFIIASIISVSTGSALGAMGILIPVVVPAAFKSVQGDMDLFILTISALLSGAVMNICSPLADTTMLSAISCNCDMMHHLITQVPYGILGAIVTIFCGYLPVGYRVYPPWAGLLSGSLVMFVIVIFLGVRIDHPQRKMDFLTSSIKRLKRLFNGTKPPEDNSNAEIQRTLHDFSAADEAAYVDILRPNFWKWSTWTRR